MPEGPILITGATGYLGRRLVRRAALQHRVLAGSSRPYAQSGSGEIVYLDVTDEALVANVFREYRPRTVIHAAAVNPGQGDYAAMRAVNTEGSRIIAAACDEIGARLVHLSSDVVHDGAAAPYGEDVPPTPLNAYGRTKADGEAAVAEECPSASIVRTSLIYGLSSMDRATAGFAERITRSQTVRLFTDVLRQPIWVETLAQALVRLAGLEHAGVLNIAGSQVMTRYDYGRALLAYWGYDDPSLIQGVRASEVSTEIPLDLRLDCTRAEQVIGMSFPGVDEVIAENPRAHTA